MSNVLNALGLFEPPRQPPYTALVALELWTNFENRPFVSIKYRNDTDVEPYEMILPGCSKLCPLDQFLSLTEPLRNVDILEECAVPDKDDDWSQNLTNMAIFLFALIIVMLISSVILKLAQKPVYSIGATDACPKIKLKYLK